MSFGYTVTVLESKRILDIENRREKIKKNWRYRIYATLVAISKKVETHCILSRKH